MSMELGGLLCLFCCFSHILLSANSVSKVPHNELFFNNLLNLTVVVIVAFIVWCKFKFDHELVAGHVEGAACV